MFRKIVTTALVLAGFHAMAQDKTLVAAKPVAEKIDYHQVGAPMPRLKVKMLDSVNIYTNAAVAQEGKKHKKHKKHRKDEQGKMLLKRTDIITNEDLNNGSNLLVMMFNPTCGHCEDQTQKMEKDIAVFKNSKLVLMAKPNMLDYLPNFTKSYHTKDYPNMYVGMDSSSFMDATFLYSALPQINIYSADHKLIRAFAGEVSIDTLKQYMQ